MEETYLFNDEGVDIANGRYAVFKGGKLVIQNDNFGAAVDAAWAMGISHPAVVDLEITREHTYVF